MTPTPFGRKLRAEIDKRGWGVRTLAREMAVRDNAPQRTESLRRQLKRYLSDVDPVRPTVTSRRFIEDTLGLERDALDDPDDAEAAQMAPAAAGSLLNLEAIDTLLMERIGVAVEKALADAKARQ